MLYIAWLSPIGALFVAVAVLGRRAVALAFSPTIDARFRTMQEKPWDRLYRNLGWPGVGLRAAEIERWTKRRVYQDRPRAAAKREFLRPNRKSVICRHDGFQLRPGNFLALLGMQSVCLDG
jgi:hypothetical protein